MSISDIRTHLQAAVSIPEGRRNIFFKTAPGEYAAHDKFLGITVPALRKISKEFSELSLSEIETLLASSFNEERLLALLILVNRYQKANRELKEECYQFYLNNLKSVNNWNLVDLSAHLIVGAHLHKAEKDILFELSSRESLWERRVAIVSTWYFIRQNEHEWTIRLAKILLNDKHDLIHKAVGWMLREVGKKDLQVLVGFLADHANLMPRTMLRYAIEKFPEEQRKAYMQTKKTIS